MAASIAPFAFPSQLSFSPILQGLGIVTRLRNVPELGTFGAAYCTSCLLGTAAVLADGFLKDRLEDRQAKHLVPELRQRHLRSRRWRLSLSGAAHMGSEATGLMGNSLRQLIPSAYSQRLERDLLRATPGGKCLIAVAGSDCTPVHAFS